MSYRQVSTYLAMLFFILFAALVLLPETIYWLFQLQQNDVGDFLAKRAGILFLGLSVLCFNTRATRSIEVKNAVAISLGTAMGAMAALGIYEFALGNAGAGILLAVLVELSIAALLLRSWIKNSLNETTKRSS